MDKYDSIDHKWKPVMNFSLGNARAFKLDVELYGFNDKFKSVCKMYRWVKFNYICLKFNCCSYTYSASHDGTINIEQKDPRKFEGKFFSNVPSINPIQGKNYFRMVWDLDGQCSDTTISDEAIEASRNARCCVINGKRNVTFFYKFSGDCRRFIGTDRVLTVTPNKSLDTFFSELLGEEFRKLPTKIYGSCDDFLSFLRYDFVQYEKNKIQYREPPCRLGLHCKAYFGCTFYKRMDF